MTSKDTIVAAIEEAGQRASRRRQLRLANAESMQMFVGCIGGCGFLLTFLPSLLHGPLGWVLGGGALLSAVLAVVSNHRRGISVPRSLLGLAFWGALTCGVIAGFAWYIFVYMANRPLLTFGGVGP